MHAAGDREYRFGPFRLQAAERILTRGGEIVLLTPKAVDTLIALVERHGRVVEKNELIGLVWPDTFVEEGGLARNVSALRKALGEQAGGGDYIETVPKRGYRFVAPLEPEPCAQQPSPEPPAKSRWPRVPVLAVAGAAVIFAALGGAFLFRARTSTGPVRSLAILPLRDLSGDGAEAWFSEGLTEALISNLARAGSLRVIAPASVLRLEGGGSAADAARRLKVEAVLEGAVVRAAGRVRVSARLVETSTGRVLWAENYDRDVRDVLALENELAASVARGVRARLAARSVREVNPEAYRAYLRGRYAWNRRTEESLRRAAAWFEEAIRLDPGYAPAYAGLADSFALLGSNGYDAIAPTEAMPKALEAARRALALDPELAEAHASLGYALLSFEWDLAGAEKSLHRAIELNPGYATAWHWEAHRLLAAGEPARAYAAIARALELDPLSLVINVGAGWCRYHAREFDRAIEQYRRTLDLDPHFALAHQTLGMAYERKGLYAEAIREHEAAVRLSGGSLSTLAQWASACAASGQPAKAREVLSRLDALGRNRYVPALYRASIHLALGENGPALEFLKKAAAEHSDYLLYLRLEPALDPIRRQAGFLWPAGGTLASPR